MASSLQNILSTPIQIPVHNEGESSVTSSVLIEPRQLIRAAADLLIMITEMPEETKKEAVKSKLILPSHAKN